MTELVIMVWGMTHPVTKILEKWPDRASVHSDALGANSGLDMVAVHRWFARKSIPPRYWSALIAGGKKRGIRVKSDDLAEAHATVAQPPAQPPAHTDAA